MAQRLLSLYPWRRDESSNSSLTLFARYRASLGLDSGCQIGFALNKSSECGVQQCTDSRTDQIVVYATWTSKRSMNETACGLSEQALFVCRASLLIVTMPGHEASIRNLWSWATSLPMLNSPRALYCLSMLTPTNKELPTDCV